jgi:hypothetical protein
VYIKSRVIHDLPFPRDPITMHVGGEPESRRASTLSMSNAPISIFFSFFSFFFFFSFFSFSFFLLFFIFFFCFLLLGVFLFLDLDAPVDPQNLVPKKTKKKKKKRKKTKRRTADAKHICLLVGG